MHGAPECQTDCSRGTPEGDTGGTLTLTGRATLEGTLTVSHATLTVQLGRGGALTVGHFDSFINFACLIS
jgi:hypothetical protein